MIKMFRAVILVFCLHAVLVLAKVRIVFFFFRKMKIFGVKKLVVMF